MCDLQFFWRFLVRLIDFEYSQSKRSRKGSQKASETSESSFGAPSASATLISKSLQDAKLPELKRVFIDDLGYDESPFARKTAENLRRFGKIVLTFLEMDFASFALLTPAERRAALSLCKYPPPHGSVSFFQEQVPALRVQTIICLLRCRAHPQRLRPRGPRWKSKETRTRTAATARKRAERPTRNQTTATRARTRSRNQRVRVAHPHRRAKQRCVLIGIGRVR